MALKSSTRAHQFGSQSVAQGEPMKCFVRAATCLVAVFSIGVIGGPEDLYKERCAVCHDAPADEKTPHRDAIELMSITRIHHSLADGRMAIHTEGLSRDIIEDLSRYLSKVDEQSIDPTQRCPELPISNDVVVSHWGVDIQNTRHQPISGIDSSNIKDIKLKYAFGIPNTGEVRSWPAISADTIFLPSTSGTLYAIDRDIGCIKWTYEAGRPLRTSAHLIYEDDKLQVAVGDFSARTHLVDASNGELVWVQSVGDSPLNMNTGAPVYFDDDWYVPVSAYEIAVAMNPRHECCKSRGIVKKLDGATGEVMWSTPMTPDAQPTKKNDVGTQMYGPSGAPVWTTPAIDLLRGVLYIGTGENTSSPATYKSDSIVSLNLFSGEIGAFFQGYKDDAFNMACGSRNPENCPDEEGPDFDFGASPILVTTSTGRDLVLAGQKSGDVWALDPDDELELVWHNKLSNGSALGGVHWGMTVAGNTLFVPIADPERATVDPKPGVYAIDIDSGETIWEHKVERGCEIDFRALRASRWPDCPWQYGFSAAASSTNDVVFAGALNGVVTAFHAEHGEVLWSFDTKKPFETVNGVEAHGGAIDNPGVVVAGNQLIVLSGYGMFGQMPGNVMLVFEL